MLASFPKTPTTFYTFPERKFTNIMEHTAAILYYKYWSKKKEIKKILCT